MCISVVLWKLEKIVDPLLVSYVDDINIICDCPNKLDRCLRIVDQYLKDFSLDLSKEKTQVWGIVSLTVQEIAERWQLATKPVLESLGAEWALYPSAKITYKRELNRIVEAKDRLRRISHLPAKVTTKASAIVVGALSLLSYVPTPELARFVGVRSFVRRALSQMHGSPEILLYGIFSAPIDPEMCWVIGCFRLWHFWANSEDAHFLARVSHRRRHSRVAALFKWAHKNSWVFHEDHFLSPRGEYFRNASPWNELRRRLIRELRLLALERVGRRRSELYEGIQDTNRKQHSRLLNQLPPHSASLTIRIWTGSAMTNAHINTH